jgi:hypothetical protein
LEDNEKGLMVQILRACSRRKLLAEGAIVRDKKLSPLSVIQPELDWIKTQKLGYLDKPFADWKDAQWNMAFDLMLRAQKRSDKVDKKPAEVPVLAAIAPASAPVTQQDNSVMLQLQQLLDKMNNLEKRFEEHIERKRPAPEPTTTAIDDDFSFDFSGDSIDSVEQQPPVEEQPEPKKKQRKAKVVKEPEEANSVDESSSVDYSDPSNIKTPPRLIQGTKNSDPDFIAMVWDFCSARRVENPKISFSEIAKLFARQFSKNHLTEYTKGVTQVFKFKTGEKESVEYLKAHITNPLFEKILRKKNYIE